MPVFGRRPELHERTVPRYDMSATGDVPGEGVKKADSYSYYYKNSLILQTTDKISGTPKGFLGQTLRTIVLETNSWLQPSGSFMVKTGPLMPRAQDSQTRHSAPQVGFPGAGHLGGRLSRGDQPPPEFAQHRFP